jgi:hypothetical protein
MGSGSTPCSTKLAVLRPGSFSVDNNGVVRIFGNEWTFEEIGISCVYGGGASPGTKLGTLTGGTTATLTANTTELPKISGGIFCASKGTWKAEYIVTTPDTLFAS